MTEQASVRVAQITDECWRVESREATLRGPYLVIVLDAETAECQCLAGAFEAHCHHRAAVFAAIAGTYPVCDPSEIAGPPEFSATRRETREERIARLVAEYDAASVARRTSAAATITDDDYRMFG